jgi:hypothetical protein
MTYRLWTSLAALGLMIGGSAQAGDTPMLGDAARRSSPALFSDAASAYRQQALASVLDDYTPPDPDEAGWVGLTSKEVGLAFRRADADSVAKADAYTVVPNPEPSSMAVWTAIVCSLLAIAHGLRQRKTPAPAV